MKQVKPIILSFLIITLGTRLNTQNYTNKNNRHQPITLATSLPLQLRSQKINFPAKMDLTLGTTMPFSGGLEYIGHDFLRGIDLIFYKENKHGGIHNHLLRLIPLDDKHKEYIAEKDLTELLKKTTILFTPYEVTFLNKIRDEIKNNLLVLFPSTVTKQDRSLDKPLQICFRPSIEQEVKALIDYAIKTFEAKKFTFLYEESGWAKAGFHFAQKYLQNKQKGTIVSSGSYSRNTINLKEAIKNIVLESPEQIPDTIICISHHRTIIPFVSALIHKRFPCTRFLATSQASLAQYFLEQSHGISLITSSVVPNPRYSSIQIAQEYRADVLKHGPNVPFSYHSFEGYIVAAILVEALKKVTPPITKEKIYNSLTRMVDIRGLPLQWNRSTRSLSNQIWINKKSPMQKEEPNIKQDEKKV